MPEIMWVLDHLDDLETDFRVFYRIDDFEQIPSTQFLKYAYRVSAYNGVVAAKMMQQQEKQESSSAPVGKRTHLSMEAARIGDIERVESTKPSYVHELLAKAK